jgi:DNA-binding NtrC family response regulator
MADEVLQERRARVLLVDDLPENLSLLREVLDADGYEILAALSGAEALKIAREFTPDLVLLDVMMPEMDGFEMCRRLQEDERTRSIPVIFITARGEGDDIVNGFRSGGVDYIAKPFNKEELQARVATHLKLRNLVVELTQKNAALREEMAQRRAVTQERDHLAERLSVLTEEEMRRWGIAGFVGQSPSLTKILGDIQRLQQTASTSVLIGGESGTGKELVARAVHFGSGRGEGPFIPVNCSAVPGELADSLFFGQYEPRTAHAAQRHHRLCADSGRRQQPAAKTPPVRRYNRAQRRPSTASDQRCAGHFQDRSRARGDG